MINPKQMVEALEQALISNIGVKSVSVDGQTVSFADKTELITLINHYKKELARSAGRRPLFKGFDFDSAW
jgi:hypothetical protein